MITPNKADASDWAWLEGNSTVNRCDAAWSRGLIELRARVEVLEAAQVAKDWLPTTALIHGGSPAATPVRLHSYSVGPAKPIEEWGKNHTLVEAATDQSLAVQLVSLVKQVAMTIGPISEGGERAGILPVGTAIAVLRQIAANARAQDLNGQSVHVMTWEGVAQWLEQEADHA
jgi:hypothetical protein